MVLNNILNYKKISLNVKARKINLLKEKRSEKLGQFLMSRKGKKIQEAQMHR